MPASFLMEQMNWREALDEAASAADFDAIEHWVETQITTNEQAVAKLLDLEPDPNAAGAQVRAWMFLERFEQSVRERRDLKLSL